MEKVITQINYNWHQTGSIQDRDGCGENFHMAVVGSSGCIKIEEGPDHYIIFWKDGSEQRIYNPNLVNYKPENNG